MRPGPSLVAYPLRELMPSSLRRSAETVSHGRGGASVCLKWAEDISDSGPPEAGLASISAMISGLEIDQLPRTQRPGRGRLHVRHRSPPSTARAGVHTESCSTLDKPAIGIVRTVTNYEKISLPRIKEAPW